MAVRTLGRLSGITRQVVLSVPKSGVVTYSYFQELYGSYPSVLIELAKELDATAVAELGGGAQPLLADEASWSFVPTRVIYDIDVAELEKASDRLDKREADVCQHIEGDTGRYDLVFSKMLCEHLPDAEAFHRNCFRILRPGGASVHFFPTLYAAPFLVNRIMPEKTARRLLSLVQPTRLGNPMTRKFPAYYRWCRGPTRRSIQHFEALGFQVEEWRVGFGHNYYSRVGPLQALEDAKARMLVRHPVPHLSSFAITVLRKPR